MKSFEQYHDEIDDDFEFNNLVLMQKQFYNAGADEKLKGMRCETCRYYDNEGHDKPSCSNHETPVGFIAFSKNFGCILHEQKEGK